MNGGDDKEIATAFYRVFLKEIMHYCLYLAKIIMYVNDNVISSFMQQIRRR